jgi:hypothetical protein
MRDQVIGKISGVYYSGRELEYRFSCTVPGQRLPLGSEDVISNWIKEIGLLKTETKD